MEKRQHVELRRSPHIPCDQYISIPEFVNRCHHLLVSHIWYSLPLQEVGHEGHIVLAVPLCPLSQFAHHSGVTGGCGKEEQATVILGVVQALLGQAKLALTDSQLR